MKKHFFVPAILLSAAICGCTVSEVITAEQTELYVATLDMSESLLLDVGIVNFDDGVPKKNDIEKTGIYPEVRQPSIRSWEVVTDGTRTAFGKGSPGLRTY